MIATHIQNEELFQLSKKDALALAKEQATDIVESGDSDPLKLYIETKKLIDFYTELNKGVQKAAQDEAFKHGKDGAKMWGATAVVVSTASRYDYSNTNDEELASLEQAMKDMKTKLEARQKFLQSVPVSGMTVVDEESGDAVKVYPPVKISGETIQVRY